MGLNLITFPAVLCGIISLAPFLVMAQDYTPAEIDKAKQYMEEGQQFFLSGRYDEAATSFMKAYSVVPFSAFLYNTGISYEKMGRWKDAAEFFERYLEEEPTTPDREEIEEKIRIFKSKPPSMPEKEGKEEEQEKGKERSVVIEEVGCGGEGAPSCEETEKKKTEEEVESKSSEMKSLLNVRTYPPKANIQIVAYPERIVFSGSSPQTTTLTEGKYKITITHPKFKTVNTVVDVKGGRIYVVVVEMSQGSFLGYLNVRTSPPDAKIFIDDKEAGAAGKTPFGKPLPAGEHRIWIELSGYKTVSKKVNVEVGEETSVNVQLERVDYGYISLKSNAPESVVTIDGEKVGGVPLKLKLAPGVHLVRIAQRGMKPVKKQVEVKKGMQTEIIVRLNPKPGRTKAYIAMAFAIASFTAGGVLSYFASSIYNDMRDDRDRGYLVSDDSRVGKGLAFSIGADASFVVGGICAIATIVYFVVDRLPDSEAYVKKPVELFELERGER